MLIFDNIMKMYQPWYQRNINLALSSKMICAFRYDGFGRFDICFRIYCIKIIESLILENVSGRKISSFITEDFVSVLIESAIDFTGVSTHLRYRKVLYPENILFAHLTMRL